jgi:hypothetical protein
VSGPGVQSGSMTVSPSGSTGSSGGRDMSHASPGKRFRRLRTILE